LLQQPGEAILGGPAERLLLRVTSYVHPKTGRAWIGRGVLASFAMKHRHTLDRYASALTRPWCYLGEWFPPLYHVPTGRPQSNAQGKPHAVHWTPLDQGWIAYFRVLGEITPDLKAAGRSRKMAP
jgi:hypothetical protein